MDFVVGGITNLIRKLLNKKGEQKVQNITKPVTIVNTSTQINPQIYLRTPDTYEAVTVVQNGSPNSKRSSTQSNTLSRLPSVSQEAVPALVDSPPSLQCIDWVFQKVGEVDSSSTLAVVGGYDKDGSPLWVSRTVFKSETLPTKLNINSKHAYVAWDDKEYKVSIVQVLCLLNGKIKWVDDSNGHVPKNAIEGGKTTDGEKLYIGRRGHDCSLIPGKIQPSHKCCYVTFGGKVHSYQHYEVLCLI